MTWLGRRRSEQKIVERWTDLERIGGRLVTLDHYHGARVRLSIS
jgi:hypothetical protein